MLRTRVIPALLLRNGGLVKTLKFKDPKYVGDPINAVRIFNEKEVDELVLLDITASLENRPPNFKLISEIASECFMPLCYGGGVKNIEHIKALFGLGIEKVAINSGIFENPHLIREAADAFGSQSIVASIDVRKNFWGGHEVYTHSATKKVAKEPASLARDLEAMGAGEIFVNSIDRDGTQIGYDLTLVKKVTSSVRIPVIACGGAGANEHLVEAIVDGGASAVAAGSLCVFHGKHRAVLISYPSGDLLQKMIAERSAQTNS